jgi:hypothetical protein
LLLFQAAIELRRKMLMRCAFQREPQQHVQMNRMSFTTGG